MAQDAKIEWQQRYPDEHDPFLIKRMSWSWFSAEIVRIQPTELAFRVKGDDAAHLALHDAVRHDGETSINGGAVDATDIRDRLTFAPAGSSVEGWNCLQRSGVVGRCSSSRPSRIRSLRKRYLKCSSIFVF
jgi:AraC family transcriptional regulator